MALGITALQSTSGSSLNITSAQTIATYANGAGWRKLRPKLRLSSMNGAAATVSVSIRNTTDSQTIYRISEAKANASDTAMGFVLPSFYAVANKSYALTVISTNASDTAVRWDVDWFDDAETDATAISGDFTASDNAEAFFDGTGYAGTNNVIPTVTTLTNKTGFALASTGLDLVTAWTVAITGNITGNLSGSVGSVTGNVGGNVVGSVNIDGADIRNAVGLASADLDTQLSDAQTDITAIKAKTDNLPASPAATSDIPAASTIADAVWDEATSGHVTAGTFGAYIGSIFGLVAKFSGITSLANWLGLLAGKTADPTTRAEINATTAGATYDERTDSQEATRDKIDTLPTTSGLTADQDTKLTQIHSLQQTRNS